MTSSFSEGLRQWLAAYQSGEARLSDVLARVIERGPVSSLVYHQDLAALDDALSRQQIDERLHRALSAKLASLHNPSINAGSESSDDEWARSTAVFQAPPGQDAGTDDATQISSRQSELPPQDEDRTTMRSTTQVPREVDPTVMIGRSRGNSDITKTEMLRQAPPLEDPLLDLTVVDFLLSDEDDNASTVRLSTSTGTGTGTGFGGSPNTKSSLSESALRKVAQTQAFMAPGAAVGVGSVLQGRFKLEKEIGRGGMGIVYRAQDENMVRARDRDPYVALKVLNDELRRHPEALVILQREARRARQLAHPNIVTVYDFHIDGATVFMTMEYVDALDLRGYIRSKAKAGMPLSQARPIINGMAAALGYAHEQGVIHSDFKPGNVMMTSAGVPKVFDFGIARAGRAKPGAAGADEAQREVTQFDAATLGALTLAYASLEMIEGGDPEPNDDLYALGCIAYELLTGRHPFNKKSAEEALHAGLKPERPPSLTNRQWKTLAAAIALRRRDRLKAASELVEGLRLLTFKDRALPVAGIAVPSLLVLLAGGWFTNNQLHKSRIESVVGALRESKFDSPDQALQQLRELEETDRSVVLVGSEANRAAVKAFMEGMIARYWNPARGAYDFPQIAALLDGLGRLYPEEPRWLGDRRSLLDKEKLELVQKLDETLSNQLSAARPGPDFVTTLQVLRRIEPQVDRGKDKRVESGFLALIDAKPRGSSAEINAVQALADLAASFTGESLALAQRRKDLASLRQSLALAEQARQGVDALLKKLDALLAAPRDAEDWRLALAEALRGARKQALDSGDARVSAAYSSRQQQVLRALRDQGGAQLAAAQQSGTAALFETAQKSLALVLEFDAQNKEALSLSAAASEGLRRLNAERDRLASSADRSRNEFRSLLDSPRQDGAWAEQLSRQYESLRSALGSDAYVPQAKTAAISKIEAALSRQLEDRSYAAAQALAVALIRLDTDAGTKAQQGISAVQQQRVAELLAATALDGRWRQQFRDAYSLIAADVSAPAQALKARVAEFYKQRAGQLQNNKQYTEALELLSLAGEQFASDAPRTALLRQLSEGIKQKMQLDGLSLKIAGLKSDVQRQAENQNPKLVARKLAELRAAAPEDTFLRVEGPRWQALAALKLVAGEPKSALAAETAGYVGDYRRADAAGYGQLLNSFNAALLESLKRTAAGRDASRIGDIFKALELLGFNLSPELRKRVLEQTGKAGATVQPPPIVPPQPASVELPSLEPATVEAGPGSAQKPLTEATAPAGIEPRSESRSRPAPSPTLTAGASIPPANESSIAAGEDPCAKEGLANNGATARRRCNDVLSSGGKGPDLVVIEASGRKFAIGKYEVRVSEYNRFCAAAGCSSKGGEPGLPVVNVSLAEVTAYSQWLTRESGGHRYQIPTAEQWRMAAVPDSAAAMKDINCTRRGANNEIEMGATLLSVTAGSANPLGLFNVFGNAAEMVLAGGSSPGLRGGSHADAMARCQQPDQTESSYDASASPAVGFRVVREIGAR